MRILIVTQYFWPESFRINDLAVGLRDRGHHVHVLTGLPNYPQGRLFEGYRLFSRKDNFQGIPVTRVPLVPRGNSRGLRLLANYASFAASAATLGPLRCRGAFDVIFVFEPSPVTVGLPAIVMKWLKKAPVLFWVQDLWPETLAATGAVRSRWLLSRVDALVRRIYGRCERVLVQSPGFIPHVESQGVPRERIVYFPNWAESFFQPIELPEDAAEIAELSIPDAPGIRDAVPKSVPDAGPIRDAERFTILFAGNIGVSQSFQTVLEAAQYSQHQPAIRWTILGDGRQKDWLESEIHTRGLTGTVRLLGHRPVETMPRYFAAADALLCTLKRDRIFSLTIPSKLQCYLACGRPVLGALDGEGAAVIRESAAGLVGPAEDARALAENALKLFAASADEREQLGRRGRRFYEQNFEREMLLDRLEGIFRQIMSAATREPLSQIKNAA